MNSTDEWDGWTDQALLAWEEHLYDLEREGDNTWEMRDAVIREINRRGLLHDKRPDTAARTSLAD